MRCRENLKATRKLGYAFDCARLIRANETCVSSVHKRDVANDVKCPDYRISEISRAVETQVEMNECDVISGGDYLLAAGKGLIIRLRSNSPRRYGRRARSLEKERRGQRYGDTKFVAAYSAVPEISRTSSIARRNSRREPARRNGKILMRRVREIPDVSFASSSVLSVLPIISRRNDQSEARYI